MNIDLSGNRFPYGLPESRLTLSNIRVLVQLSRDAQYDPSNPLKAILTSPAGAVSAGQEFMQNGDGMSQLIEATFDGGDPGDDWLLTITGIPKSLAVANSELRLDPKRIEDSYLIIAYARN